MSRTKPKIALFLIFALMACPLLSLIQISHAQEYAIYVDAYNTTENDSVEVPVSLNGNPEGNTPLYVYFDDWDYLNINETDTYGGNFQYWDYQGYHYLDNTFWLYYDMDWTEVTAIYSGSASPPSQGNGTTGTSGVGNYTFYGLIDEDTGVQTRNSTIYSDGVFITAFYSVPNTAPQRFWVNGSYGYNVSVTPQYFSFNLGSAGAREYWIGEDDTNVYNRSVYVFNSSSLTTIGVSFNDLTGALNSYDLCSAQRYVNGSLLTVDQRRVDVTDRVVFILKPLTLYTIKVSDGSTYTFGDVTTAYTEIELTLKGIEIGIQDVILQNKYVRFHGIRDNDTITVTYQDTQETTTSVYYEITYNNGTVVYNATHTDENEFQDSWSNAIMNVTYRLTGTIVTSYGTMTASQIFPGSIEGYSPWSLEFLGTFPSGVDSSQIIPAILILFVFGTFSVLNAYLGAFLGTIVYAFFGYMGWMNVNSGIIVAGMAFSIILGITYAKRRLLT